MRPVLNAENKLEDLAVCLGGQVAREEISEMLEEWGCMNWWNV